MNKFDDISTEWFMNHFEPHTIDKKNEITPVHESDRKAQIIRRPNYKVKNNEDEIVELFPKIRVLSLKFDDENKNVEEDFEQDEDFDGIFDEDSLFDDFDDEN